MRAKDYILLFISGILVLGIFAYFQTAPGYMDAEYYYAMGLRIVNDRTFSEPFLWNYLNGFSGLPAPGFTFWMPLPAFFAALSMLSSGLFTFLGARLGFLILSGLIPILTSKITYSLSGNRSISILAGFFAVFSAFYSPFLTTTDAFGIVMLIGAGFFITAQKEGSSWKYFMLGILVGMMHLTRTDGFLWMFAGIFIVFSNGGNKYKSVSILVLGYFLAIFPWLIRNWISIGNVISPGSSKMLWLSGYDDLFLFNTETLNLASWLDQGFKEIIGIRLLAVINNLKTFAIVQGQIILLPLVLIGLINNRKDKIVQAFTWTWILVFGLMSIVFPYAGTRGGFFHSGAAFQTFFWALAAIGFSALVEKGILNREWKKNQAQNILGTGLILLLAGITLFVLKSRVIGPNLKNPQWNRSYKAAVNVGSALDMLDVSKDTIVMINNPPGLYIAAERSAIAIPNSDPDHLYQAMKATNVKYLVLEKNHSILLDDLYLNPKGDKRFEYLSTQEDVNYFKIQ